jgi:hypothetical protein
MLSALKYRIAVCIENVERMDNGALDWKGKNYILFKLIKTNRSFADESEEAE